MRTWTVLKSRFDSVFDGVTMPEQEWVGLSDGELRRRAKGWFDVLVAMDQNLPYQQNLPAFGIVLSVDPDRWMSVPSLSSPFTLGPPPL